MAPGQLSLFPAPTNGLPRRSSSLKRPAHAEDLQGVAFHVTPALTQGRPKIQPANNSIQHPAVSQSSVVEIESKPAEAKTSETKTPETKSSPKQPVTRPSPRPEAPRKGILKKPSVTSIGSKESSCCSTNVTNSPSLGEAKSTPVAVERSPQPQTAQQAKRFTQVLQVQIPASSIPPPPPRRPASSSSSPAQRGRTSPLLDPSQLRPLSPPQATFQAHSTMSRAASPSISRSDSMKKEKLPSSSDDAPPMRSMFPTFDPTKPLSEQNYYPTIPTSSPPRVSSLPSFGAAVEKKTLKKYDSVVGLVEGYEHIPGAEASDHEAVWTACRGEYPMAGRKVQFGLYQPHGHFAANGTALSIGMSPDQIIYDMNMDLAIRRHRLDASASASVAQLDLPDAESTGHMDIAATEIFPHAAAIQALDELTLYSADDANMDALQRKAMGLAHRQFACSLIRRRRRRDPQTGTVTASYQLAHPTLGTFPIEVTRAPPPAPHMPIPKAKISLHHPSATPPAIAAGTLNLAFLDFARDACVLDVPGLVALGAPYLLDTVVAALLAVAVTENDALVAEAMVFAAPPTAPVLRSNTSASGWSVKSKGKGKTASPGKESKKASKKASKKKQAKMTETDPLTGEQVELPLLARGTIAVLGLSVKAAVFVLHAGFKVTTGVVVGVSHLATKL